MTKKSLKFFLPFEFDQAPQIWDPWKDTWEKSGGKLFIFNCFKKIPFDGILISKPKFDENRKKYEVELDRDNNIKNLLKLPKQVELFGDCGAFQYKDDTKPPYSAKEILDYYQNYGFDMGCSIDHIIYDKKDENHANERYEITKRYAKECIKLYAKQEYSFQLFGVAQGWDIQSYSDMIDFLYELGYEYLCIGGLVGVNRKNIKHSNDLTVINLLRKLAPKFTKFKKIHIFGRGNLEYFKHYIESGVTQFDNNIMRKSWTDEKRSYQIFDKNRKTLINYTTIRIRLIDRRMGISKEEQVVFNKLNDFDNNRILKEDLISTLKKYNEFYRNFKIEEFSEKLKTNPNSKLLLKKYNYYKKNSLLFNQVLIENLLNDKPWEKCECDLCKKYEIHICVFRRRMRNTLRAFHNVYNYYLNLDAVRANDRLINQKEGILKFIKISDL